MSKRDNRRIINSWKSYTGVGNIRKSLIEKNVSVQLTKGRLRNAFDAVFEANWSDVKVNGNIYQGAKYR